MAFKKMTEYNEERYGNMFLLRNDGDSADVVILYRSVEDVLVADVHYIKSPEYSGYVHCCGRGCPACAKGIRVQNKLFIPLYNINENQIQFFDRSTRFENVLQSEVFSKFSDPTEYVFRITRRGEAGSMDTRYEIVPIGTNTDPKLSYDSILKSANTSFPEAYEGICRDISPDKLQGMLNVSNNDNAEYGEMPSYQVTPRGISATEVETPPDVSIPEGEDIESETDENVKF